MKTVAIICFCFVGAALAATLAVGGFTEVDVKDQDVLELVDLALDTHNAASNSDYYKKAVEVISARRQVVAGSLYELKVLVGETHCAREDEAAKLCPVDNNGQQEECVFRVWKKVGQDALPEVTSACTKV